MRKKKERRKSEKEKERDKTGWWVHKSINRDRDNSNCFDHRSSCHSHLVQEKRTKKRTTTSNAFQQVWIEQAMI